MSRMNREAYQRMVDEDIAWLEKQEPERPPSPANEKGHILMILRRAVEYEYGPTPAPRGEHLCESCGNPIDERFHNPITGRCI